MSCGCDGQVEESGYEVHVVRKGGWICTLSNHSVKDNGLAQVRVRVGVRVELMVEVRSRVRCMLGLRLRVKVLRMLG